MSGISGITGHKVDTSLTFREGHYKSKIKNNFSHSQYKRSYGHLNLLMEISRKRFSVLQFSLKA